MRAAPEPAAAAVRFIASIWWRIAIICPRIPALLSAVKAALTGYGTGSLVAEEGARMQAPINDKGRCTLDLGGPQNKKGAAP